MNYLIFWATFIVLFALVFIFDRYYFMLRDNGTALPRPYSFSRVQLAWWTVIVLTSFISIIIISKGTAPTFDASTLYLLGISSATTIGATLIDVSDQTNPNITGLAQNMPGDNFFLDILSDKNGVNVHRFQTVVFNLVFGLWFIINVLINLSGHFNPDHVIPVISANNLILLGVSSGVYATLKATENKQTTAATTPTTPVQTPIRG
ncbi:hypothetical protein [uncultured Mucilaginibacter sp.]|uniref:hypothetical protein n=1 Tax=uncultured Mucilaginibacter sp. TaxID=797541 RepID=UPI0025EF820F|nr:hypothetical protein [uncultured Mucilaginibacter sp.]